MCYMAVAIVTDYDSGLDGNDDITPVAAHDVLKLFSQNIGKAKDLMKEVLLRIGPDKECNCSHAMDCAVMTH